MKKFFTRGIAAMFIAGSAINTQAAANHQFSTSASGIYFEENKGQIKDQHWQPRPDVLFSGNAAGMNYFLRKDGISYQFVKQEISEEIQQLPLEERMKKINETPVEIYRVDVNWKNTNKTFSVEKVKALSDVNNYYNMPNGKQPALGVKKYEEVWLRNIWTGVDMHYFSRNGVLESDWVLARAANYTNIAFEIKGAELSVEGNELVMKTPFGTIREGALKSLQEGKEIVTKWHVEGKTVRLLLENFNPEKPITIDPPTRAWATYYGGGNDDRIWSITTDTSNNVVATGFTFSNTAIATTGAHLTTLAGGSDAFVVKLNSNGVRQWGTYFGGAGNDNGRGICTNNSNFVFIAGVTVSSTGISTTGVHQTAHANTSSGDAFLAMFDPNGTRIWGTYYGGTGADEGNACAIYGSTVYLAGTTASATGIATITPGLNNGNGGTNTDAFLVKFNVSTALRVWGRYVGGTVNEEGNACTVDASGNVYIGGASNSNNYFANSASNPAYASNVINGSVFDVFVAKYNTSGAAIWSGTLGSTTIDRIRGLATDAQKNLIAVGTFGGIVSSFATTGAHQTTYGGGSDAFIIKSDSAGNRLWRTYYGSNFNEEAYGCAVSSTGRILLVTSVTANSTALFTTGAYQTTYGGGFWDANAAIFTPSGSLNYATYYGGSLIDEGLSGAFDKTGAFYFGGFTSSTSAISTTGTHQETFGGSFDGFLVKFNPPVCPSLPITITATPSDTICPDIFVTLSAQVSSGDILWQPGGQTTSSITVNPLVTTTYTISVTDNDGCVSTGSKTIVVRPTPTAPTNITGPDTICNGSFRTYKAFGAQNVTSYFWTISGNATIQSQSGDSVTIFANSVGTFTLTVSTLNNNCGGPQFSKQFVIAPSITANISPLNPIICQGESVTLTASGGSTSATYTWSNSLGSGAVKTVSPTSTTTYTVTISNGGACTSLASKTVTVITPPTASISPATVTICSGESTTLTASGGGTYAWSNSGGTNAQATFTPTTTTTYTVTVTASNGCTATASRLVTVNPAPNASISPATITICSGASTTLTASGGGTYAWSNSGGSNAQATFTPTTTTTYTVTVTAANNCTATASRTVNVNPAPNAAISPATVAICEGQSATLTASGGTQYAWSNSGGSNAQATFSPTTTTTYTVTVTDANNCSATASRQVTVNANPTATITPPSPSICNGASQTLTASGGNTYAWSNSLGSGATKSVSPTATTTYTVTVTNAANCTATASATVTVNTVNASINGPSTICSGLPATLTASGGTSYAWSNGGGTNAQATFTPTTTTTYTVTVTGAGGCTATASQTVSVQSQPTASISGPTEVCNGSSVTLTANGGNTYTWSNNQTTAAITVSPTQTTTYTVTVSIGANCTATATRTVTVKQPSASSLTETICFGDSYTFKNQQLTQSGTYRDTLTNAAGCDSVITLNLTVRPKVESTVNVSICAGQSYAFNNQQLTQAGQYFDTLTTVAGCDSFITLNLTVNSFVTGSISQSICQGQSFTFNGQQLTQAGQYLDTLTSVGGCDSILTLTLTVNPLPQPTITQNGNVLSTQTFNSYQWQLNGNNINGATNQNFTATQNGSYTVQVTDANGCSNTSGAVNLTGVGVSEVADFRSVIYPNPVTNVLNIESDEEISSIQVADITGRIVTEQNNLATRNAQLATDLLAEATYYIYIKTTTGKTAVKSFVKQ